MKIINRIVESREVPENENVYWLNTQDSTLNRYVNGKWVNVISGSVEDLTDKINDAIDKRFIPFSSLNDGIVRKSPVPETDDFGYTHYRYLTSRGTWEYPDLEHSIYRSKVVVLKYESSNDDLMGFDDVMTVTIDISRNGKVFYTTETNDDGTIERSIQLSTFHIGDIVVTERVERGEIYPARVLSKITNNPDGTKTYHFMKLCN